MDKILILSNVVVTVNKKGGLWYLTSEMGVGRATSKKELEKLLKSRFEKIKEWLTVSIKKIREDIEALKGANVRIFGQPTKLPNETDSGLVDILEIIDELEKYEVTKLYYDEYNEETDSFEEKEFPTVDEYLDYLDDLGDIDEISAGNSYNWSGLVSHDFNYTVYKNNVNGNFLIDFSVHRFGDVRGNYTDSALLEFDYEEGFLYAVMEVSGIVDLKGGYYARFDALSDSYEIFDSEGDHMDTIYDLEDFDLSKYETVEG